MNSIRFKYIWFMSLCLLSSQLVSMEKPIIRTANELRTLAFAAEPEDYANLVEKYVIRSSAVTESVATLLGVGYASVPDDISQDVQVRCNDDYLYKEQIIQIMQEYRASNDRQGRIKNIIYVGLNQKIYEKNDECNQVKINRKCFERLAFYGTFMSGVGLFTITVMTVAIMRSVP